MNKQSLLLTVIAAGVLLLPIRCKKLVSFSNRPITIDLNIEALYQISSATGGPVTDSDLVNLAEIYSEHGVDPGRVEAFNIANVTLTVTSIATGGDAAVSDVTITYSPSSTGGTLATYASLGPLSSCLGVDLHPLDPTSPLALNAASVDDLKAIALSSPPPTITFSFNGTANSGAEFEVRLTVTLQVTYRA